MKAVHTSIEQKFCCRVKRKPSDGILMGGVFVILSATVGGKK